MQVTPLNTQQSDEEIVLRVQKGDTESFGVLVERYQEKLLRYGKKFLPRHEDIQDIVQDAFVSSFQNIKNFDTSQRFSPWIYRIAHNAFVNALKKKKLSPLALFDFDTLFAHHVYEDPAGMEREQKEMKVMLEKGLEKLQPKYKEVLILYYLEEISYKEIADILEVPTGTVGIRIKRAKEELKKIYDQMNIHYGA